MTCDEVRDLTGAYVLGSTTGNEKLQIESHVAGCDRHAEIASLAAVTLALASAAPEDPADPAIGPSPGLGERISAAIRAERDAPDRSVDPVTPAARPGWWRAGRFRVSSAARPWSIAAALAVAVGALVVLNVTMRLNEPGEELVHFFREADGDWVRVEATLGEPNARVSLGGFDPLPPDRDYQLWAVRNDSAISLGVFDPDEDGKWSGNIDFPLERGDLIAITEEAEGGSDAPTTDPLLSTRL
ncbi:MAG: anti-sigma factor [Chloroflexi bacterium]|nr:anti-sigma factor [Chloroflexota bacterium]